MTPRNGRIPIDGRGANGGGVARWACVQGATIAPMGREQSADGESGRPSTATDGRGRGSDGGDGQRRATGRKGIGGEQTP